MSAMVTYENELLFENAGISKRRAVGVRLGPLQRRGHRTAGRVVVRPAGYGAAVSNARKKAAAKAVVENHPGVRSCGRICRFGPVSIASNGKALVTVQLVIDAEDIERELARARLPRT